jgi:hypothetical protein
MNASRHGAARSWVEVPPSLEPDPRHVSGLSFDCDENLTSTHTGASRFLAPKTLFPCSSALLASITDRKFAVFHSSTPCERSCELWSRQPTRSVHGDDYLWTLSRDENGALRQWWEPITKAVQYIGMTPTAARSSP